MYQPQRSKRPRRQLISRPITRAAPTKGWNARDPEASMAPGYALYLINMWPTAADVELRKGAVDHVTGFPAIVQSLLTYNSTTGVQKLFAATAANIYDATVPGIVGASVAAVANGRFQSVNYTTTGGSFLLAVNGVDQLQQYNGAAWSAVPSFPVTGGGSLNTQNIHNLLVFKRQLFFIEKSSMSFYYLPIDQISGTVSRYPLGALFRKGGYLVAAETWTIDGGEGVDDYCVFATSEGQLAVYKGTDPSNANAWALQGVYDLGAPLGLRCFSKFGGDVLYLSRDGLYPLSKALQSTTVNLKAAVTDLISTAFSAASGLYGANYGWDIAYSLKDSILVVNVPTAELTAAEQYCMNTITGAWARFTGWDVNSLKLLNNVIYATRGTSVVALWQGGNDFGATIFGYAKPAFDYFDMAGSKHLKFMRPIFKTVGLTSISIMLDTDFANNTDYGPTNFSSTQVTSWAGAGDPAPVWAADSAVAGGGGAEWAGEPTPKLDWGEAAAFPFYCAAPRLRIAAKDATVSWSSTNFVLEAGEIL